MRKWILSLVIFFISPAVFSQSSPLIDEIDLTQVNFPSSHPSFPYFQILQRVRLLAAEGKRPVVALDMDDTLFRTNAAVLMAEAITQLNQKGDLPKIMPMLKSARAMERLLTLLRLGWISETHVSWNLNALIAQLLSKADPDAPMQALVARQVAFSTATLVFNAIDPHSLRQMVDQFLMPQVLKNIYPQQLSLIQEVLALNGTVVLVSATADPIVHRISQWLFGDRVISIGMQRDVRLPFAQGLHPPTVSSGKLYWVAESLFIHDVARGQEGVPRVLVATLGDSEFTDRAFLSFRPEEEGAKVEVDTAFRAAHLTLDKPATSIFVNPGEDVRKWALISEHPHILPVFLQPLADAPEATRQSVERVLTTFPNRQLSPHDHRTDWLSQFLHSCHGTI